LKECSKKQFSVLSSQFSVFGVRTAPVILPDRKKQKQATPEKSEDQRKLRTEN